MNKKKFLLLLVAPLTACNFGTSNFSWESYKNNDISMNLQSAKFKSYKLCGDTDKTIQDLIDKIEGVLENKGKFSDFSQYYNELNNKAFKIIDSYMIATTKYYSSCDKDYGDKADELYGLYTKILTFEYSVEEKIYNSSNEIKTAYFGDMTDEEIQSRLAENENGIITAQYDALFQQYKDDGQELYMNYVNGDITKSAFLDDGYDYFLRYINKANEFVKQIGCESYLDYSYVNDYARDYSPEDAMNFVNYVKKYFVPIYKENEYLRFASDINYNLLDYLQSYNFCNQNTDSAEMFLSYAEELGGKYLEAYNNTFKYGYYCFSDDPHSMATAFQWGFPGSNDSILYFSKKYQNILCVIHEFGHLYSYYASNGKRGNDAYDLQETYSQADEYLFLNYLVGKKDKDENKATYEYFANSSFYENLGNIINFACIAEIENFAFTQENLDLETLRAGAEEIIASYQGTASETYFMSPCISQTCYYISYATSIMEACQFLLMDFETGKENYKKLVEAPESFSMVERWKNAGLDSPFEEEAFEKLSIEFLKIAEKY